MNPKDIAFYKELFLKTAKEYLESLDQNLSLLNNDPNNKEAIETSYIAFHSLGSQNAAMGYRSTSSLCRMNEYILLKVKEGKISISLQIIDELIKSKELIKNSILNIELTGFELDMETNIKRLEEGYQLYEMTRKA